MREGTGLHECALTQNMTLAEFKSGLARTEGDLRKGTTVKLSHEKEWELQMVKSGKNIPEGRNRAKAETKGHVESGKLSISQNKGKMKAKSVQAGLENLTQ